MLDSGVSPDAFQWFRLMLDTPGGVCLILRGERISRRQLITYVANKLAGVHLDLRRDPGRDQALLQLDMAHNVIVPEGRRAVFAELVTVGQCLVLSPDVDRFLERAHEALLAR
jgi:hypothetical protein